VRRSHILARELRGTVVVVLVALMIMWLFTRLSNDRAAAQAEAALRQTTTTEVATTTSTTIVVVDDNQRLCSLASAFRNDLREIPIVLINQAGDRVTQPSDPDIDVGLHPDGDIPDEVRQARTVAAAQAEASGASVPSTTVAETTSTVPEVVAVPPPTVIDTDRLDPLESGLLGEPQQVALNFYTAAATLRLGTISADFAGTADYFADFVTIGEDHRWDLEELAESEFSDQWTALSTRPVFGVNETLAYIEDTCSIRIGGGFLYREEAPDLPILDQIRVDAPIDPGLLGGGATEDPPEE